MARRRLFLTGASGFLGREIFKHFKFTNWEVYGTALTRVGTHLHKLDLKCFVDVEQAIIEFKPTIVIHCAALRSSDRVDANPNAAINLNVIATRFLAEVCRNRDIPLLFISSDEVFDGRLSPYAIDAEPCPISLYGSTKLHGEKETIKADPGNIVLRIPLLYGEVDHLGESDVSFLLERLLNTGEPMIVSDIEKRYPSHVSDIAFLCQELAEKRLEDSTIRGIFHWCGSEMLSEYGMICRMSDVFDLPSGHIQPVNVIPLENTNARFDTKLDTSRLDQMGLGRHTMFNWGIFASLVEWTDA